MKNAFLLFLLFSMLLIASRQKETALPQAEPELQASIKEGQEIYNSYCMSCHMSQGEGIPGAFPPLAGADYLMEDKERSIRVVMYGLEGEIVVNGVTYDNAMTPMGLTDEEIAHVLNYVRNSWGNEGEVVTFEEVKKVREAGE
ncbi:MAG: c-type cytochrome [Cyclobacteriaceae bacterium]